MREPVRGALGQILTLHWQRRVSMPSKGACRRRGVPAPLTPPPALLWPAGLRLGRWPWKGTIW